MAKTRNRVRNMELGSTGLRRSGGFIDEEFLLALRGPRRYRIFSEMRDNDPVIGAIMYAIEMFVRATDFQINPADDTPEAEADAKFVKEVLEDMSQPFEDVIIEALSAATYGFSFHEIVYKKRDGFKRDQDKSSKYTDGRFGWAKLPIRAQDSLLEWKFDKKGRVEAFVQQDPIGFKPVTIPMEKGLLFRIKTRKDNPEGISILRNAYRPWFFKKRIEEIEGVGIERDLNGLPVIRVPAKIMGTGANSDEQAAYNEFKNIVVNVRRDEQEGIILPSDRDESGNLLYDLQLLTTNGRRQFDTNAIINRYDQRIAMVVLADFVLLGHEGVGSFALSSDKTTMFASALGAILGMFTNVLNNQAIPRLFRRNGVVKPNLPKIEFTDFEKPDLEVLGNFLSKLKASGLNLFPNNELEESLSTLTNYTLRHQEEKPENTDNGPDDQRIDEDEDTV